MGERRKGREEKKKDGVCLVEREVEEKEKEKINRQENTTRRGRMRN